MPRTKAAQAAATAKALTDAGPMMESFFDELRTLMEARRAEYQASADRISEILTTLNPKPRIGRPPKQA